MYASARQSLTKSYALLERVFATQSPELVAVDHLCQALVLLTQKIKLFFAVSKIHGVSPITFDFCLCLYKFFLFCIVSFPIFYFSLP